MEDSPETKKTTQFIRSFEEANPFPENHDYIKVTASPGNSRDKEHSRQILPIQTFKKMLEDFNQKKEISFLDLVAHKTEIYILTDKNYSDKLIKELNEFFGANKIKEHILTNPPKIHFSRSNFDPIRNQHFFFLRIRGICATEGKIKDHLHHLGSVKSTRTEPDDSITVKFTEIDHGILKQFAEIDKKNKTDRDSKRKKQPVIYREGLFTFQPAYVGECSKCKDFGHNFHFCYNKDTNNKDTNNKDTRNKDPNFQTPKTKRFTVKRREDSKPTQQEAPQNQSSTKQEQEQTKDEEVPREEKEKTENSKMQEVGKGKEEKETIQEQPTKKKKHPETEQPSPNNNQTTKHVTSKENTFSTPESDNSDTSNSNTGIGENEEQQLNATKASFISPILISPTQSDTKIPTNLDTNENYEHIPTTPTTTPIGKRTRKALKQKEKKSQSNTPNNKKNEQKEQPKNSGKNGEKTQNNSPLKRTTRKSAIYQNTDKSDIFDKFRINEMTSPLKPTLASTAKFELTENSNMKINKQPNKKPNKNNKTPRTKCTAKECYEKPVNSKYCERHRCKGIKEKNAERCLCQTKNNEEFCKIHLNQKHLIENEKKLEHKDPNLHLKDSSVLNVSS